MSLSVIAEFWSTIKPFLATSDRPEAAETLVNILIDNDFDPKEVKRAFGKDGNIINALGLHDEITDEEEDEEDEYIDYDYEDDEYEDDDY